MIVGASTVGEVVLFCKIIEYQVTVYELYWLMWTLHVAGTVLAKLGGSGARRACPYGPFLLFVVTRAWNYASIYLNVPVTARALWQRVC